MIVLVERTYAEESSADSGIMISVVKLQWRWTEVRDLFG